MSLIDAYGFGDVDTGKLQKKGYAAPLAVIVDDPLEGLTGRYLALPPHDGPNYFTTWSLGSHHTFIVGQRFYITQLAQCSIAQVQSVESQYAGVEVRLLADGKIRAIVWNNSNEVATLATSTKTLTPAHLDYIWAKITIAPFGATDGRVLVYVGDDPDPWIDYSGRTNWSSGSDADKVRFAGALSGATVYRRDIVILDGLTDEGAEYADILPYDPTVTTKIVAADSGTYSAFSPSTGDDTVAMVDDATPDDATTHVYAGQVDDAITFTAGSLGLAEGAIVLGIKPNVYAAKNLSDVRSAAVRVRAGGENYDHTTTALSTTWGYLPSKSYGLNPNTGEQFTVSEIESGAVEVGAVVKA